MARRISGPIRTVASFLLPPTLDLTDLVDCRRCAAREPASHDDDHRWGPYDRVSLYGSGSRAAGPLPECARRACLQHAAKREQRSAVGPTDRLSAEPAAE